MGLEGGWWWLCGQGRAWATETALWQRGGLFVGGWDRAISVPQDNLKIPGSVTSRINLWISRTQEPAKDEKSKVTARAIASG